MQAKTSAEDSYITKIIGNELQILDSRADKASAISTPATAAVTESSESFANIFF